MAFDTASNAVSLTTRGAAIALLKLRRRLQVCWGSLHAMQPLICYFPALLIKGRREAQVCIVVHSEATATLKAACTCRLW